MKIFSSTFWREKVKEINLVSELKNGFFSNINDFVDFIEGFLV